MATFTYSIREAGGRTSSGTLSAESRVDALNNLRNKGHFVIELNESLPKADISGAGFGGGFFQRVKLEELAVFTRQLAAMVGAGISITRCLKTLASSQKNAYFSSLLRKIQADVSGGMPMSAAMSKYPRIFNPMVVSLLVAAEETGTLDTTLDQLSESFEAEVNLRQQIAAGMRYPQIVAVAAAIVVGVVMVLVIPQFAEIFRSLDASLPMMTTIVLLVANALKAYWYLFVIAFIAVPWILRLINTFPAGRRALDFIKLRLPVFGDLSKKIILARISRVFSTMLSAGVPILKTLSIVEQTSLNAQYEESLRTIRNAVKEGRNISGPMEAYPSLYPPLVNTMIAVGEESGTLDHMLMKINHFYTSEIEATVKKLTALLEPVMIMTLGSIIGFIVIALWMPLFSVIKLIQELD